MKIYGVICAGGTGTRMGANQPKQLLEIEGRPVIARTIDVFLASKVCDEVLVLMPEEWLGETEQLFAKLFGKDELQQIKLLAGGKTRNDTILNAIDYIEEIGKLHEDTIILTHDAARPFATVGMIEDSIDAVKKYGAATVAVQTTDTILLSDENSMVDSVVDRKKSYAVQTPQSFYAKEWRERYMALSDAEKETLTDASKVYILQNRPVKIIEGTKTNFKITYPTDIAFAETIARELKGKK